MSLAPSEALNGRREKSIRRLEKSSLHKHRVLAAVDGTERSRHVISYILDLADRSDVEVVLLNVQPEPEDWRLRGYASFKREEIRERLINDRGWLVVTGARRRLEKAGIKVNENVRIGDFAAEAAKLAKKEHCNLIVIGEPKTGGLLHWLVQTTGISFSSTTNRLVQLADMPVVIVK